MKNFQSIEEGAWVEMLSVPLTKEQVQLRISRKEEDAEAKKELAELIKSQREGSVPSKKKKELTAFYNSVKPETKESDTYQLISIGLIEKEEGVYSGILNCRVNGEHKQIRF